MSANEFDEFDDESEELSGNDLVKDLRRQLKAANKKAKEAEDGLADLRGKSIERTIRETLESKGANPKLARHVARDIDGDVTEEAVLKWLDEEGEAFGFKPAETGDNVDVGEVDEAARQAAAASGAAPPMPADMIDAISGLDVSSLKSEEELSAALAAAMKPRG